MNPYGYIEVKVTEEMVATAIQRAEAGDAEGGTGRSVLAERWHGHLGEGCVRAIYKTAGIDVVWDGGVNDAPDFTMGVVTGDVKTFTIHRGPFRPAFYVGVVDEALEKTPLPDGLVFCVYDHGEALLTALGSITTLAFQQLAVPIKKGEPLKSRAISAADGLFMPATELTPMVEHLNKAGSILG